MKLCKIFLSVFLVLFFIGCNSSDPAQPEAPQNSVVAKSVLNPITINSSTTIPLWESISTKTFIYVHNRSNSDINNLRYSISDNTVGLNNSRFVIDNNSCTHIAAHSKCALKFTTPALSADMIGGSALLSASYFYNSEEYHPTQILKYQVINDTYESGVLSSSEILVNTSQNSNSGGKSMLYLYSNGPDSPYNVSSYGILNANATIQENQDPLLNKEFQNHEIRALEVSIPDNSLQNGNLKISSIGSSGTQYSSLVAIMAAPFSTTNIPILIAGTSPVINVSNTLTGYFTVLNAGNASATIGTISASVPPNNNAAIYISTGINQCTTGVILAPNSSCNVYLNVNQVGSNSDISINYTPTSGGGTQTLMRNVVWYNPIGGALVSMAVNPSFLFLVSGTESIYSSITMKNVGGYDIHNLEIVSTSAINGSAITSVSTPLSCTSGNDLPAFSANTCSYVIQASNNTLESQKYIKLVIKGTYTTNDGPKVYTRASLIGYTTVLQLFTWMNGSRFNNNLGVSGPKGAESSIYTPSARYGIGQWKANNSNHLWIFGGYNGSYYNDLWRYNTTSNNWAWISGSLSTNQLSTYGTKGIESLANIPGGRNELITWVDNSGNFWSFGGYGYANSFTRGWLSDLWKYNTATNQWTWMNGPNTINIGPTYGAKYVESAGNNPPAVYGSAKWVDESGNFWLFGGWGCSATAVCSIYLNQLWKYNVTNNQWAWMGSGTLPFTGGINAYGQYGTKGVASANNTPGSRCCTASWKDESGNFWLFGGVGYAASGPSGVYLNDLWKYSTQSNQWTWIGGTNTGNSVGIYTNQGVPSPESINYPGSRFAPGYWVDKDGYFWLFGGQISGSGYVGDLWKYNTATNQWTWIFSNYSINIPGSYGTITVESAGNKIGTRYYPASWADESGNFWLFGGWGSASTASQGGLNDMWRIGSKSIQ